ncbi:MAG: hypothetical protein H6742_04655 [Alphaproteobacteria bacterium]|nr:hypothetical protein [Alphaproteobacteria bacterium]
MLATLALTVLSSSPAHAGKCDAIIKRADSASGDKVAEVFAQAVKCDKTEATDSFARFMTRATDSDSLVALSLVAIDAGIHDPVGKMPSKISDYDVRDAISGQIGAACGEHPDVVTFLKASYFSLRGLDFAQWDDGFLACESPEIDAFLGEQISKPPARSYDEKYDQLMSIWVQRKGAEGIPALQAAAIAGAEGGPYDAILMKLEEAVAPDLGQEISADNKAALEGALVEIAKNVSLEQAKAVAEKLFNAGSEQTAASLMPTIYADRVQGGGLVWGGLSVERADCKGTKTAVLHAYDIKAPAARYTVFDQVQAPLRAAKPKLKKCTVEEGEWPVAVSPEPLSGSAEEWARKVGVEWANQGYTVEVKPEGSLDAK